MSFQSDLYTLMTADVSTLNIYISNDNICFENLKDNYNITKDWLVYSFKKSTQQDILISKNVFVTYIVYIRLLSMNTVSLNLLGDYVQTYLNNKSQNGIQDIKFITDTHSFDLEKGQYSILLEFEAIYL
jgi:hypothetical protein